MAVIDKVTEKEKEVRELLQKLRNTLNNKRLVFNKSLNDWSYLTDLAYTEKKLKEIMDYIDSNPQC